MALPLIPIAIVAGASSLGLGSYFGLRGQKEENKFITNQRTTQQDFISNTTTFDLNEAFIENSTIDLSNFTEQESGKKSSNQRSEQERSTSDNLTTYLIVGGVAVGAYLIWRQTK